MNKVAGFCAITFAVLASGPALADGYGRSRVPAPIPVPAPVPVPETFTYYLRGDLGWSLSGTPSFSESGAVYGGPPTNPLTSSGTSTDNVFFGGIGAGAYLSNRFRADITLDFFGDQEVTRLSTYVDGADTGTVRDRVTLRGTVGLANIYWDLMPRGHFTPYVGAGIGFVYNDISRSYLATESPGPTTPVTGSSHDTNVGLAGALMAGVSISTDHRYAWDFSYRALYVDGGSITTTLSGTGGTSSVDIGGHWDHQFRVGLRVNLW
jgi:opacity protein-like surface antigen